MSFLIDDVVRCGFFVLFLLAGCVCLFECVCVWFLFIYYFLKCNESGELNHLR